MCFLIKNSCEPPLMLSGLPGQSCPTLHCATGSADIEYIRRELDGNECKKGLFLGN